MAEKWGRSIITIIMLEKRKEEKTPTALVHSHNKLQTRNVATASKHLSQYFCAARAFACLFREAATCAGAGAGTGTTGIGAGTGAAAGRLCGCACGCRCCGWSLRSRSSSSSSKLGAGGPPSCWPPPAACRTESSRAASSFPSAERRYLLGIKSVCV